VFPIAYVCNRPPSTNNFEITDQTHNKQYQSFSYDLKHHNIKSRKKWAWNNVSEELIAHLRFEVFMTVTMKVQSPPSRWHSSTTRLVDFHRHDPHTKRHLMLAFIAAGTSLPSSNLATARGYIYRPTHTYTHTHIRQASFLLLHGFIVTEKCLLSRCLATNEAFDQQ
jgi:hypothetical protein